MGIELAGTECHACGLLYFHESKSGIYECPNCDEKATLYYFDDNVSKEDIEQVTNIYKGVIDVCNNNGLKDISPIKVLDFILEKLGCSNNGYKK